MSLEKAKLLRQNKDLRLPGVEVTINKAQRIFKGSKNSV